MRLMTSTALLTESTPVIRGLGLLDINYHEFKCLGMGVYFLLDQLNQQKRHYCFTALRDYHVRNIEHWLSNQSLKSQLRFDASNSVFWPVVSSEDALWLIAALKVGIHEEETIISMASDDAAFERDMAIKYADSDEALVLAESVFYESFKAFHKYYCHMAECRDSLIDKLKAIVMH